MSCCRVPEQLPLLRDRVASPAPAAHHHGAPQRAPAAGRGPKTGKHRQPWARIASAHESLLTAEQGEKQCGSSNRHQHWPAAVIAGTSADGCVSMACSHHPSPLAPPPAFHHQQVAELASGAKQAAVLESDSGRYNYSSCRSSSDSGQEELGSSADPSSNNTRPATPAVGDIPASVGSYSSHNTSMSVDAPGTPSVAQQQLAAAAAEVSPAPVPSGLKNTFSKIFGSNWGTGSETSSNSGESSGHGLIAAFRAIMPKTSGSQSGSGRFVSTAADGAQRGCLFLQCCAGPT